MTRLSLVLVLAIANLCGGCVVIGATVGATTGIIDYATYDAPPVSKAEVTRAACIARQGEVATQIVAEADLVQRNKLWTTYPICPGPETIPVGRPTERPSVAASIGEGALIGLGLDALFWSLVAYSCSSGNHNCAF